MIQKILLGLIQKRLEGNHNLRHILDTETSIKKQLAAFQDEVNVDTGKTKGFDKDVATLINIAAKFPQIPAFKTFFGRI